MTAKELDWLEREDIGDVTVIRVKDLHKLDEADARQLHDMISSVLVAAGRGRIVLNLTPVDWLPSVSLANLVQLDRKAQAAKGRLVLCCLSSMIIHLLGVTHLKPMFVISADEAAAVELFTKKE
jgi:anti-anti-sigma factor